MENQLYKKPKVQVNTNANNELWEWVKSKGIPFNELLEFGIKFKMAELENFEFPNNIISQRLAKAMQRINELNEQLYNLSENKEIQEKEKPIGEELKEVFGDDIKD